MANPGPDIPMNCSAEIFAAMSEAPIAVRLAGEKAIFRILLVSLLVA
jgi:hypothetical protein